MKAAHCLLVYGCLFATAKAAHAEPPAAATEPAAPASAPPPVAPDAPPPGEAAPTPEAGTQGEGSASASTSAGVATEGAVPTTPPATTEAASTAPPAARSDEPPAEEEVDPLGVVSIKFKPGTGLIAESRDKRFAMALRSRVQLRYEMEHVEGADPSAEHIFMVRRARFQVAGHFFGEHNKYKLQLALSPRDMNFGPNGAQQSPVLDAILSFDYLSDFVVSAGQYMVPFSRQRIISSGDFELVDRSIGQAEYQMDRDVGVQVSSNDIAGLGYFRYLAGIFMGEGRDAFNFSNEGLLYVVRLEAVPTGDAESRWDYEEGDLERTSTPQVAVGAAYGYHDSASRNRGVMGSAPTDGGTTNFHALTWDATARWYGVTLTTEWLWRAGERNFGNAMVDDGMGNMVAAPQEAPRDGMGGFIQAGWVVPTLPLGIAARYGLVRGIGDNTSLTDGNEVGAGPSWYIDGHDLKLQADYFRFWNGVVDISDGEDLVRVQLTAGF